MTWCLDSFGIFPWRILPPAFIKPLWKTGCKLAIFELLCTKAPDDSVLSSWGNDSSSITCRRSGLLEADSIAVKKLKLFLMCTPLFLFIQSIFNLMIHTTWRANVKNDEYHLQLIFDAKLLCFLHALLVTFVFLLSKCSLVLSFGSTVWLCLLFVKEYMLRLFETTFLWRKSGPTLNKNCKILYNVLSRQLRIGFCVHKTTLSSWNHYKFR